MKQEKVAIQLRKDDTSIDGLLEEAASISYTKLETASFDGQSEVVTVLITITPMALTFLGKVISEYLKSKKYIKVIYKGVQIQGMNEKNATEILKSLCEIDE